MSKFLKCLWTIIETALIGSFTIFTCISVLVGLYKFADKYLNNNIFACILLGALLLVGIWMVGTNIKNKLDQ